MIARASQPPSDLISGLIEQKLAGADVAANVKTVQAFDAMLDELPRLKQAEKAE